MPLGNFRGNRSSWGSFSMSFLNRALDKIHRKKLFAHGKIKSGREPLEKIKKRIKKRSKEERRSTILSRKEKKVLCESERYRRSSTLASRFQTKKSPSNQTLPHIMLKTRFSFYLCKCQPSHGFFLCLKQLCPLLCRPSQRFNEWSRLKKKSVSNWLLFAGNLDPSLFTPGGPLVPLACGFRGWNNLLAWRELGGDATTLSDFIECMDLTDFR